MASLNSSTKNSLIMLARGALELEPDTQVSATDPNLVAIIKEFREQTKLQQRVEPMLIERRIPQTLKQVSGNLDTLEGNRSASAQAAYQSLSPRTLDLTARVSERTEQHVRLVEDTHKIADETNNFFRSKAKQLWGKDAKKSSLSRALMQEPDVLKITKEKKELLSRLEDLAKNLPELAAQLKKLNGEIKSFSATAPVQSGTAPRQEPE